MKDCLKAKVLIIPSWYPTASNPLLGSFFQEQALVMKHLYDIKIFYPTQIKAGRLFRLFNTISFFLNIKPSIKFVENNFINNPENFLFHYTSGIGRLNLEEKILAWQCNSAFEKIIETGWKPDLIHAHCVDKAGIIAYHIKLKYNIPYVITEHMPFNLFRFEKCFQPVIKETFQKADLVLSISYDKIRQLGMNGIDISPNLVYNYVNENLFKLVSGKYRPGEPLKIISIAAASFIKDHLTLLKAIKIIKARKIPFSLTLIGLKTYGEENTYNNILEFIENNGLKNDIQIIDKVDRGEIPKYLHLNSIFLITSIAEGLPVSVLEAMASGLIVIATKHGGTEDILTKETGILVKIKDSNDIADRLVDIFQGKFQLEPKIIRDHVVSICGTKAFSQRLSNYYEQVIQNNLHNII